MFLRSWLALAVALVFYVLVPLLGAILARTRWRQFRERLFQAAGLPRLSAGQLFGWAAAVPPPGSLVGLFIACGEVEAIGPDNRLWLRMDGATCIVNLDRLAVYTLGGGREALDASVDPEMDVIEHLHWKSIPTITQGVRLFVAGRLIAGESGFCFVHADDCPLLVILHDGLDEYVLPRALIAGRHRNEYWNPLTQVSLAVGILAMSGILGSALGGRTLVFFQALNLTLAFGPILPFLPPGFLLFFVYRRWWALARRYRAERDIATLRQPGQTRRWQRQAIRTVLFSMAAFGLAVLVNGVGLFLLLRLVL
ncbi:MAG: hypothetical protein A2087_08980 [Spirochaetes bacterium GWD1_61_31]|nr:MAG: hypothetical protein A2Y37_13395 [Spirochaetes bacterium GWB1_60_80]OHD30043.1 MAG: hypothetical protein A2004_03470 [Spirochaetes bacterium GWC1_61_12]OHD42565.1 MAG: hypothetical protein A2087_08980 [Spirochaetes bacterium GWD1_61_31]OHD45049.1 MAG: hypothetical protein A2Y35_12615 [Spirochaetes bacterium GWE1_60_18]OHD59978.1 MAG: hypothetical protein A2Y32_14470 [Spirochaetes bacterium GWF1_60_12]HAP42945.1 hypothetical protein [Spirochaetaceae bacterium]